MMPAPVLTINQSKEQQSGEEVIVLTFRCIEDARTIVKQFSINAAKVCGKALFLCGCNQDLSDGQLPDESNSEPEQWDEQHSLNSNNTSRGGWQKKRKLFQTKFVSFVSLDFFRNFFLIHIVKLTTLFFNFCFLPETKNVNENRNSPFLKPPKTNTFNWLKPMLSLYSPNIYCSLYSLKIFDSLFFRENNSFLENFTTLVSVEYRNI